MSQTYKLEKFEEEAREFYRLMPESESTMHHTFTPDAAFAPGRWKLNKRKRNVVFFNWEEAVRLVRFYGFDPRKLRFVSDGDWKSQMLTTYCPEVIIVKYNDKLMTKYARFFDSGAINPPFAESKQLRTIAEQLVTNKLLVVTPTRDFENPKMLEDIEYYYTLGDRAFSEQISTALCIVDVTGTKQETVIEDREGRRIKVTDMPFAPGEDLDAWLYAIRVTNLGLPGYHARNGKGELDYSKAKNHNNGTLCVFTVGKKGDKNFGKTKYINNNQLKHAVGLGEHKLLWSKTGSIGKLPTLKYGGPDVVHGFGTLSCAFDSKQEVLDTIDYLESSEVTKLVKGLKTNTVVNGVNLFKKIPLRKYQKQWTLVP
jgi:hypothetical protein